MKQLAIPLVKLLAIPLTHQKTVDKRLVISNQKTVAKWLVISSKLDVELTLTEGEGAIASSPASGRGLST